MSSHGVQFIFLPNVVKGWQEGGMGRRREREKEGEEGEEGRKAQREVKGLTRHGEQTGSHPVHKYLQ